MEPDPITSHEAAPAEAAPAESVPDELEVLDQLVADLTAVELAIDELDRVTSEGMGGSASADRIMAAVSPERFGPDPDAPVRSA